MSDLKKEAKNLIQTPMELIGMILQRHNEAILEEIRDQVKKLTAENERLRKLHERNLKDARPSYDNEGHRCDWRVRAEAMAERSRAALEENDDE